MTVPGEEVTVGDKIIEGFTETSATNPYNDGKTYLAPMFYSPCGLFYNAGLLEEKGWEVPPPGTRCGSSATRPLRRGIYLFTYPTAGYFDAFPVRPHERCRRQRLRQRRHQLRGRRLGDPPRPTRSSRFLTSWPTTPTR